MRKTSLLLTAALAAGLLPAVSPASAASSTADYIITFIPGSDAAARAGEMVKIARVPAKRLFKHAISGAVMNLTPEAAAALAKNKSVMRVELDGVVAASDTQAGAPWGLDRIDQATLPLSGSYNYLGTGANVDAYIVDTGILSMHTEFGARTKAGYSAIADGNGTTDCNGHGTHVAGTVGGAMYGVAKAVSLIPVRVLDCTGSGSWSGVIAGLDWIVANHQAGVPAVANMSLGGGASLSVDDAVRRVIADGVTVAVAAGNSNVDACTTSPARVTEVLTVGATTNTDARASYSNFGKCLDMFAPGSSITSAWSSSTTAVNTISGTSMASPHVAGAAAALLGRNPTYTPAQVAYYLASRATANVVSSAGTGSPNKLLFSDVVTPAPVTVPATPTNVAALAGRRSARVSWTAPANGGSAITSYTIGIFKAGFKTGSVTVSPSSTTATVTGLLAGVSYQFTVTATNAVGSSPVSALSGAVTPTR